MRNEEFCVVLCFLWLKISQRKAAPTVRSRSRSRLRFYRGRECPPSFFNSVKICVICGLFLPPLSVRCVLCESQFFCVTLLSLLCFLWLRFSCLPHSSASTELRRDRLDSHVSQCYSRHSGVTMRAEGIGENPLFTRHWQLVAENCPEDGSISLQQNHFDSVCRYCLSVVGCGG